MSELLHLGDGIGCKRCHAGTAKANQMRRQPALPTGTIAAGPVKPINGKSDVIMPTPPMVQMVERLRSEPLAISRCPLRVCPADLPGTPLSGGITFRL
ncbi:hypothetical protein [Devosia insulae]|uniref:hypothetical protein n=1 Tax=Devosia insulae TaxID=408174 RepID=UPI00159F2689|nr:hypothetical protein [Devosia insulae]